MKAHIVSKRYAEALFAESVEQGKVQEVVAELQTLSLLFDESADVKEFVKNPLISKNERISVLEALRNKQVIGEFVYAFLSILVAKNRLNTLPEVAESFNELYMEKNGEAEAEVTVAVAMDDSVRAELKAALVKLTGKKVSIIETVDPSIIGGFVAKVGSSLIDASIKGQLEKMKESLV